MTSGTVAFLGSILALLIVFFLGKKYGKSEESKSALNTLTQVAQSASDAKSQASAEVSQAKAEVAQAKSEQSKAEAEKVNSDMKAALVQNVAKVVLELVNNNQQSDSTMAELQEELETAKRYNNMEQALEVARKQAARAVELGMTEEKKEEE